MRETLNVIQSEREGSAGVVRGTLSVILNECEGSVTVVRKAGKTLFKVIDSSLRVTIPFPVFLKQHSCVHSE